MSDPGRLVKEYATERIVVTWEPRLCIHSGHCTAELPAVFDRNARPWIRADAATADAIVEIVSRCPSGALHVRRLDGGPEEIVPDTTTIEAEPNGPLYVRGRIRITTPDGTVIREDTRVALCRCGHSSNKPFCDSTHEEIGFTTEDGERTAEGDQPPA
jgi:CDGSH-type Zn-finger protein/uncharacterized Fe-S cluster protein YjdI